MSGFVLDSSALLAMLLDEPGAKRVVEVINGAWMSSVNLAEVVGHYAKLGLGEEEIRLILRSLPIVLESFNDDLAYGTGLGRPWGEKAGLSLGDRACLTLAKKLNAQVLTSDRAWKRIENKSGVMIELIR